MTARGVVRRQSRAGGDDTWQGGSTRWQRVATIGPSALNGRRPHSSVITANRVLIAVEASSSSWEPALAELLATACRYFEYGTRMGLAIPEGRFCATEQPHLLHRRERNPLKRVDGAE